VISRWIHDSVKSERERERERGKKNKNKDYLVGDSEAELTFNSLLMQKSFG
jgi:hypothetical protein